MVSGERKYKSDEITVYWKPSSCIHASTCINELPRVFRSGKRPWVRMDGASTEEIIRVVDKCPVDALTWKWNDEKKNALVGKEHSNHIRNKRASLAVNDDFVSTGQASIRLMKEGPLVVNGTFFIERETGNRTKFNGTVSLCRCGRSDLQPFCDGSHREIK